MEDGAADASSDDSTSNGAEKRGAAGDSGVQESKSTDGNGMNKQEDSLERYVPPSHHPVT